MKSVKLYQGLCIIAICFFSLFLKAQTVPQNAQPNIMFTATDYISGGEIKLASNGARYGEMDGSPYLYNNWLPGEVVLNDHKVYNKILLKYDQIQDMVIFKYGEQDSALMFALQPIAFKLIYGGRNERYLNGFAAVDGAGVNSFYQVLNDDSGVKLLKRVVKKINKTTAYNSVVATLTVISNTTYYLARSNKPEKISANNKAVISALKDKSDAISKYIADNKLNVKNDDDFARVIDYYNSR